jgi:ARID/BRIGHT DNA binding domain
MSKKTYAGGIKKVSVTADEAAKVELELSSGSIMTPLRVRDRNLSDSEYNFYISLARFMRNRRTPYSRWPKIGGKEVNLHDLYMEVHKRGGVHSVVANKQWKSLARQFTVPGKSASAGGSIRSNYFKYLFAYERVYALGLKDTGFAYPPDHRLPSAHQQHSMVATPNVASVPGAAVCALNSAASSAGAGSSVFVVAGVPSGAGTGALAFLSPLAAMAPTTSLSSASYSFSSSSLSSSLTNGDALSSLSSPSAMTTPGASLVDDAGERVLPHTPRARRIDDGWGFRSPSMAAAQCFGVLASAPARLRQVRARSAMSSASGASSSSSSSAAAAAAAAAASGDFRALATNNSKRLRAATDCVHGMHRTLCMSLRSPLPNEVAWALDVLVLKSHASEFVLLHGTSRCAHSDTGASRFSVLEALAELHARLYAFVHVGRADPADDSLRFFGLVEAHRFIGQLLVALHNLSLIGANQPLLASHPATTSILLTHARRAFERLRRLTKFEAVGAAVDDYDDEGNELVELQETCHVEAYSDWARSLTSASETIDLDELSLCLSTLANVGRTLLSEAALRCAALLSDVIAHEMCAIELLERAWLLFARCAQRARSQIFCDEAGVPAELLDRAVASLRRSPSTWPMFGALVDFVLALSACTGDVAVRQLASHRHLVDRVLTALLDEAQTSSDVAAKLVQLLDTLVRSAWQSLRPFTARLLRAADAHPSLLQALVFVEFGES